MIAFFGPETVGIAILVGVLVFGASRLPQIARSVGQAKGEFEKGLKDGSDGAKKAEDDAGDTGRTEAKRTSSENGEGS